ncbi:Dicer-like protein 2, partial [Elasticomyces elasticus]
MASAVSGSGGDEFGAGVAEKESTMYRSRNYQLEMLEASLKENVIIAMDTGSGKTHVAILRILTMLENTPPDKIVWFLAPTVALCMQQHGEIASQVPAAKTRILTGLDKVDFWTEQGIWDAVLQDIQIVVSTHAVLADALTHGFVRIDKLGLIIFDEAHHCMRGHAANRIMRDFYHPTQKAYGRDAVPLIMGLTASPVVRSDPQELLLIESNLHSVCRTPRLHRSELVKYTQAPVLHRVWYAPSDLLVLVDGSQLMGALIMLEASMDLEQDPYVKRLRRSPCDGKKLQDVLSKKKTYCREQITRFRKKSEHILEELGGWAVDYFIHESILQLDGTNISDGLEGEEMTYLIGLLAQLPTPNLEDAVEHPADMPIAPKLESLIAFLGHKYSPDTSGLVFVKQRATVAVMAKV